MVEQVPVDVTMIDPATGVQPIRHPLDENTAHPLAMGVCMPHLAKNSLAIVYCFHYPTIYQ